MFFPIKITLKKTGDFDQSGISLFDGRLNEIAAEIVDTGNFTILTAEISLPMKLILAIRFQNDGHGFELDRFSLAGLDVDKNALLNCSEYKYSSSHDTIQTVEQLHDLESYKTFGWHSNGYGIINIFHPNPFAWHLYIGNKIKI